METVTITKEEHQRLLRAEVWVDALEAAGVDNWEGCAEAAQIYHEFCEEEGLLLDE